MSHFTVMVVGDDVEGQLAAFHEFECTGHNDEHVVLVDRLSEALAEYESQQVSKVRAPDGTLYDYYDDQCYRDPSEEELTQIGPLAGHGGNGSLSWSSKDWGDGLGYRPKVHRVPDGWEVVSLPQSQVQSFGEFLEDWYGWKPVPVGAAPDVEGTHKFGYYTVGAAGEVTGAFDRTNADKWLWVDAAGTELGRTVGEATLPGAPADARKLRVGGSKWDWYQVGGRWHGFFQLKRGATGELGSPSWGNPGHPGNDRADSARKGDIDFTLMRDLAEAEAGKRYDDAYQLIANKLQVAVKQVVEGQPFESWEVVLAKHPDAIDQARKEYHAQPAIQALRAGGWYFDVDQLLCTREEYCQRARNSACSTFAVLKDGVWYERGQMGWFGCVADEQDTDTWSAQFAALLDGLPDDTLLTVVDCHI